MSSTGSGGRNRASKTLLFRNDRMSKNGSYFTWWRDYPVLRERQTRAL